MKSEFKYIRKIFIEDDASSLQNQINGLIIRDCFYRTHNEGLKAEFKTGGYASSFFLEHFHDDYFLSQSVRLRRLLETYTKDKRKKTYSLLSALNVIKKNVSKLTLEKYLDLPLNGPQYKDPPKWVIDTTRESRIQNFKFLSGKAKPNLQTTINANFLDKIEKILLSKRKRLYYHLNKYWLHSSDPINRKPAKEEPKLLSLNYLQNLLITSVWAAKTLSRYVDVIILCEMPTYTFDPLIGSEIVFSERSKKHAARFFTKRKEYYVNAFSKYDDNKKFYLSSRTFITEDDLR